MHSYNGVLSAAVSVKKLFKTLKLKALRLLWTMDQNAIYSVWFSITFLCMNK